MPSPRLNSRALYNATLSRKCGFATFLDPRGGRPAWAGLGALRIPTLKRMGATALLAAMVSAPAAASQVLLEQSPLQQVDAAANGTDGQAPLLAETFTFAGTAHSLAWWGTRALGFQVSLYTQIGPGAPAFLSTQDVASAPAGFAVEIDGLATDIYRYSIELGTLAEGQYALAVSETLIDADGATWYWLHGSAGDGASISGLGERDQSVNAFDLSLQVIGDPRDQRVPEPASWVLAATAGLAALRGQGTRRRGASAR